MEESCRNVMESFIELVNDRTKDQHGWEFLKIRCDNDDIREMPEFSSSIGTDQHNSTRNRYRDIVPYDYSRVTLEDDSYINASFVNGAGGKIAYIAAQGPLLDTVADFWRMIAQYKITVVIMLCKLFEIGKSKCTRYWPREGETLEFDSMVISLLSETDTHAGYTVRTLKLEQNIPDSDKPQITIINQLHYIDWPDRGSPDCLEPLLDLLDEMRKLQPSDKTPILVHCSAGCGRTGTLCALDYVTSLINRRKLDDSFSVQDIVLDLRKQRPAMVQSLDQYVLLHRAIAEIFRRHLKLLDEHIYENWPVDGAAAEETPGSVDKRDLEVSSSSGSDEWPMAQAPQLPQIVRKRTESFDSIEEPKLETPESPKEVFEEPNSKKEKFDFVTVGEFTIPDYPNAVEEFPEGPEESPQFWTTRL